MSKVLKVVDGSYRVVVADDARITLDVGPGGRQDGEGTVYITGDLVVEGVTSTIETLNTTIEDNIIELNKGETGSGIQRDSGTSGLRIDRGDYQDALWVFDESVAWTNTALGNSIVLGTWSPRYVDGTILGIETVSITTNGNDLNLLGQYSTSGGVQPNPGKVTLQGVGSDYKNRVTDLNDVPNKDYVDTSIETFFDGRYQFKIEAGETPDAKTSLAVFDNSQDGTGTVVSRAELTIDGIVIQEHYPDYASLYGIIIEQTDLGTEIKTDSTSGNDLILGAMGTGNVVVEDNLRISRIGHEGDDKLEPDAPTGDEGTIVYADHSGAGATGLYFVNTKVVTNAGDEQRDELISRNRALVYSMLF
jgi:hypothetical protein